MQPHLEHGAWPGLGSQGPESVPPVMRRYWFPLAALAFAALSSGCGIIKAEPSPSPQIGVISGVVTGPTGPIAGAGVRVTPQDNSYHVGQTDAQGYYSLSGIPAGTVTLVISAPGYMTYTNPNVVISNNSMVTQNVSLTPM